ncbi:response regulator transcription factor [Synechococcus sp. PCC 7336]|uniref:response regulator n=1 Tax=Synechococcus sp. PCC 7336 TaxID=195250 RepID=UPI00034B2EEC|nr:response regulator transcription factor [Synechococcus sp. PCC 7336]
MSAAPSLSILLVDDEPQFRQGMRMLLGFFRQQDWERVQVVGEAASAAQAIALAREQHPALILLDLELSAEDGIAALQGLREAEFGGKVLVLSAHREDEWVFRSMRAGASGYLFKDRLVKELSEAIATVMRGDIYLSPEMASGFFRMFHFYAGQPLQACRELHLTEREQEVLHWLVQGESNESIARHLYVTVATVKAHLTAIFDKLQVRSRTQAIVKALKLGLVSG